MSDTWQHLLTAHTRGSGGSLTQSWVCWSAVQSCLSLRRIVKWMCWRSNVFASNSSRNLVRRPQKRTKCYNKHLKKQRWVGPRHLSGIPDIKMAARPSTMIRTQAGHQRDYWPCQCSNLWEPTFDDQSDCWWTQLVIWHIPSDTDAGSWNQTRVGNICSPTSHTIRQNTVR
jgi:hypothetical protein